MIRSMKGTILTLFVAAAGAALAQNSDLGLLAGISGPKGQTSVSGAIVSASGSVAPSFQANYAWQVIESKADLYVELPFVAVIRSSATVVTGPGGETASSFRVEFLCHPRSPAQDLPGIARVALLRRGRRPWLIQRDIDHHFGGHIRFLGPAELAGGRVRRRS